MAVRWLAKTTLQLGALFGLCHLFHVYNRQKQNRGEVLKFFPYPMNITTVQFAVGTVVAFIMWVTGILQRPKVSPAQLAAILPMAMVHTMVNLFTNMNLGIGKVAVSFTHLHQQGSSAPPMEPSYHLLFLRKLEPYYYLLLPSVIFLGQLLAAWFVVSLSPTTVALQSSNVPSKKIMVKTKEPLDSINLLSIITVMSFALLAPITFLTEGVKLAPRALQSAGLNLEQMHSTSLFDALCFHAYQQGLYMILARVSQHTIKRLYNNKLAQGQGCSSSHFQEKRTVRSGAFVTLAIVAEC